MKLSAFVLALAGCASITTAVACRSRIAPPVTGANCRPA